MAAADRRSLDPSAEEMRRLGYAVVDRTLNLATLPEHRVARRAARRTSPRW
jgi:hypothetical protein